MKRAIPVLLLALAAVAAFLVYPRWRAKPESRNALDLSGNIEAHESLVGFKVGGRVIDLPVHEGQQVVQGQLLAQLDANDYRQEVAVYRAGVGVRQSQLQLALAGSRSQDVDAAEQSVLDAQADLEEKKRDLVRYRILYRKDEVSGRTRDQAQTAVERAQANVARLQQIHDKLVEGTRKEEIAVARANLREAQQALRLSRVRLGYTRLVAPLSGVVLVRQAELGEVLQPGAPVVTVGDLDHVWVRVYVPETDLGRVRLGQQVTVRTDSYPGKSYRGRISFLSSAAEFTPKSVQTQAERVTLVYRAKVDVDNPNQELKPGMPADVYVPLS